MGSLFGLGSCGLGFRESRMRFETRRRSAPGHSAATLARAMASLNREVGDSARGNARGRRPVAGSLVMARGGVRHDATQLVESIPGGDSVRRAAGERARDPAKRMVRESGGGGAGGRGRFAFRRAKRWCRDRTADDARRGGRARGIGVERGDRERTRPRNQRSDAAPWRAPAGRSFGRVVTRRRQAARKVACGAR